MSVSIIMGGQYGSEGKGKISNFWAKKMNASAVVRVGGPNSGHTVYDHNGNKIAFSQLPGASIYDGMICVLPAGSYINVDLLHDEILKMGIKSDRLIIDPNAVIVDMECKEGESQSKLKSRIGSTLSGTGYAVSKRVMRVPGIRRAEEVDILSPFIGDTKLFMRSLLNRGSHIVIEGTQGYGLSNLHAKCYPYATSRDTSAAGFLSETGLSPFDVEHIVMVIRAFPIRVAGNSGPLANETSWESVTEESGSNEELCEYTTVTHNIRRVARFDPTLVVEAISSNCPDVIVLNHVDYFDMKQHNLGTLSDRQLDEIAKIEKSINRRIDYVGNGPDSIIKL